MKSLNLVRPETESTDMIADIHVTGDRYVGSVMAALPERDETFRLLMHGRKFAWNPSRRSWVKPVFPDVGDLHHVAADIASHLLANKFAVRIHDAKVYQMVVEKSFEPERRKVIYCEGSRLIVTWPLDGEDFFDKAHRIKGANRREPGSVSVPVASFDEIEDFAKVHEFHVFDKARDAIVAARQAFAGTPVVSSKTGG